MRIRSSLALSLIVSGVLAEHAIAQVPVPLSTPMGATVSTFKPPKPANTFAAGKVHGEIERQIATSRDVVTVHLRPLFTTAIRLPVPAVAIAVGAPTLFEAESSKTEPRIVFIKPSTHKPAESNLLIELSNNDTLSLHLVSEGDAGTDPVDFVVNYQAPQGLLQASGTVADPVNDEPEHDPAPLGVPQKQNQEVRVVSQSGNPGPQLAEALQRQMSIASPHYVTGAELSQLYPIDKGATQDMAISFGRMEQRGDTITFAFSIQNLTRKWLEILPPQVQFENPAAKAGSKKNPTVEAGAIPIDDYVMTAQKIAPGARLDGAVQYERPEFKNRKEQLMLQIAKANEIDTAVLIPISFVVPEVQNGASRHE